MVLQEYLDFTSLDKAMQKHPYLSTQWGDCNDLQRRRYHDYIHGVIEAHPWKGIPVDSPVQIAAFPRVIDGRMIHFTSDPLVPYNHPQWSGADHGIATQVIVDAVAWLLQNAQFLELKGLRDIGVTHSRVGPLETEFLGQYAGTQMLRDDPLPSPLWKVMRYYSLEFVNPQTLVSVPLARG